MRRMSTWEAQERCLTFSFRLHRIILLKATQAVSIPPDALMSGMGSQIILLIGFRIVLDHALERRRYFLRYQYCW